MSVPDLQAACELGQQQLMRTEYWAAEKTLADAEAVAWKQRNFETLSRLYMPLQEARRQRRQRCGEGIVALDLVAQGPGDEVSGRRIVENYPHGQLLVAGWGSIAAAIEVRRLAQEHELYVETFLAAVYPAAGKGRIVIVPNEDAKLPPPAELSDEQLPKRRIVLAEDELPAGSVKGTAETYAGVMAMWERLHAPFLAAADAQSDPIAKMKSYRDTIRVDYACELAHQKLSAAARDFLRLHRQPRA